MRLRGYFVLLASVMAWMYFLALHFKNDSDDPSVFSAHAHIQTLQPTFRGPDHTSPKIHIFMGFIQHNHT